MKHEKPPRAHEDLPLSTVFGSTMGSSVTDVLGKGASIFGRSFATMQKEGMRFAKQRLDDNIKAVEAFGACRSLPDFFAAQQRWFADMTRAYSEEWLRYSEMMTEMSRENSDEAEGENRKHPRSDQTH